MKLYVISNLIFMKQTNKASINENKIIVNLVTLDKDTTNKCSID